MSRVRRAAVACVLAASLAGAPSFACVGDPHARDFSKHPAKVYTGPRAAVDFASDPSSDPLSESEKKRIRDEVAAGPNFAGAYRLIELDRGKDGTAILVVSLSTGKIYRAPGNGRFMYRLESSLLIVPGICAVLGFVVFDGERFHIKDLRNRSSI